MRPARHPHLSGVPHTLTLTVPLAPASTTRLVLVNSPMMKQTEGGREERKKEMHSWQARSSAL